MNFLPLPRRPARRARARSSVQGAEIAVPEVREDVAPGDLALGVRPEHIRFDDSSQLRGAVYGTEYLGTTQIVTVETARRHGQGARAGRHARQRSARPVGLALQRASACRCSTKASGRAIRTALHDGGRPWLRSRSQASPSASATPRRSRDLDLTIADGEFVVLLGPTGAGKTTTLRLIAGLERPDAGAIRIGGRDVDGAAAGRARRRLRLPAIFALSASDGLRQPRLPAALAGAQHAGGRDPPRASRRSAKLVRIDHKLENRATQLSGGEMQRVAIGRALVRKPSIYLMDEPLSSLDAKLRADLRLELKRIQAELGATHALRHARPDRGDDHGRPHRHPRTRAAGADRHAARDLHRAGQPACRGAARPAGDQPAAARACCPTPTRRPARRRSARAPSI